jgi:hypothetical protein
MRFLCWCNLNPAYHILSTKQTTQLAFGLQSRSVSNSSPLNYIFFRVALRPNAGYGLLIHELSRSYSAIYTTVGRDSSGRVISSSQRHLPVQHTTDRHPCAPVGFEPTISAGEWPQTYASDRVATGIGSLIFLIFTIG